jgi:methionine synthase II (cobalamin-independent)
MSAAPRLNPPFRADHIGSLKRPEALLKKRADFDAKKCTQDELRAVEDEAIKETVEMQRKAGIRSITDGEFRRYVHTCQKAYTAQNIHLQAHVL